MSRAIVGEGVRGIIGGSQVLRTKGGVIQPSGRLVFRGARVGEEKQLVNRKGERANIGIEEADNGGGQRETKMEFWRLERQTVKWSTSGGVRTISSLSYSSTSPRTYKG